MSTTDNERPVRLGELVRSAFFAVELAWRSDRHGLLQIIAIQLGMAVGLGGALALVRSFAGDVTGVISGGGLPELRVLAPGILALLLVGTASGVFDVLNTARSRVLAVRLDRYVVNNVLRTANQEELPQFEHPDFHDRLKRAVFASRHELTAVVMLMTAAAQSLLMVVAVLGVFATLAWWLLPFALLSALPTLKAARDERNARFGLHYELSENRRVREYLEQVLTGRDEAKEIRALRLGKLLRSRWQREYDREIQDTLTMTRHHVRHKVVARFLGDGITVVVLAVVWWMISIGVLDLTTAAVGLVGLWLLSSNLQQASSMLNGLGDSLLYLQDVRTFNTSRADQGEEPPVEPAIQRFGELRAEAVNFGYPGSDEQVLRDVDVRVPRGEVVALVGSNGSGKTTLAKILAGLYQPDTGQLVHDGTPLADSRCLRDSTAVVFQDFARYKFSALDNITFGRPGDESDPSAATEAAAQAGAHEFIARLRHSYETTLGKEFTDGTDPSGGQWQRLALARAFYRDAPLVILDEPTAALDPEAEANLFDAIRELFVDRSVLLISHRFSSVRSADRIYVLDGGTVVEHGNHDSLMRLDGTYARLFRLQGKAYQDPVPVRPHPAPV